MAKGFTFVPAHRIPLAGQADVFNRAFHGYLAGWVDMDDVALARFVSVQGADFCHSRFVTLDGAPVGFGYINCTGNISRLSGMGVVPEARRRGAASWLLKELLKEAKERDDKTMMLEVFEQNSGAVDLYRQHGFQVLMRLHGWRHSTGGSTFANNLPELEEISPTVASQLPRSEEYPEIPWQISRHAIAKLPIAHAFRTADSCIVIGDTAAPLVRVHACFNCAAGKDDRRRAFAAVVARFPESKFFAPAIFPEQIGTEVFQPLGFAREPLNQFLMRRDL